MSEVRPSHLYLLLILFLLAGLPVAAFAQNNSAAVPSDGSSAPSLQLTTPIASLSQPSEPFLAYYSAQTNQAAPPPPQVKQVTKQIKQKVRRWHVGGRIGLGLDPELVLLGLQSQIGPVFNPRLILRPNAEFGFGELTDMWGLNLEAAYQLREQIHGRWTPYFGAGPSLNFVHQGTDASDVSFSDFSYKTGFNIFVGAQKGKTFLEMKTTLWSGKTPVLRLFVGYNF